MLARYGETLRRVPRAGRLFFASEAVAALAAGAMGAVFNLYVRALGFDAGFLANLLTVTAAGAGLGAAVAGWVVDLLGPRRVLLGASLITAAGIAGQLLSGNASVLLVAGGVTGLGASAYYVAAAPFLARAAGDAPRDDVFSLDTAVVLACGAVGTAAAGQLAALLLEGVAPVDAYRVTLFGAGAVGALSFPFLLLTREPVPATVSHGRAGAPAQVAWWREIAIVRLVVIAVFVAAGAGLFAPYVNLYFVEELGASPAVYGWLSAAATATRLAATLVAPALAGRIGTVPSIAFTQLASVPLLLLLGFGPTLVLAGGAFLLRGALMNMAAPLQVSFRMGVVSVALHGTASSAVWLADQVTRAGSTWVGGQLVEVVGFRWPYVGTATCYVCASLLYLFWFRERATPR